MEKHSLLLHFKPKQSKIKNMRWLYSHVAEPIFMAITNIELEVET